MNNTVYYYVSNVYICAAVFLITSYMYFKISVLPINKKYKKPYTLIVGCSLIAIAYASLYPFSTFSAQVISFVYPSVFYVLFEKKGIRIKALACFKLYPIKWTREI